MRFSLEVTLKKKRQPYTDCLNLQICSANPRGIGVIPNLEMAKCKEIKAAQQKIKGSLSNVYENEKHGKLKPTNNTETLVKGRAIWFACFLLL